MTLLRFLQDQQYRPLGSSRQEDADVRIISATNRRLDDDVTRGGFRSDLLYRLRILQLTMPPLRERAGDRCPTGKLFHRQVEHALQRAHEVGASRHSGLVRSIYLGLATSGISRISSAAISFFPRTT